MKQLLILVLLIAGSVQQALALTLPLPLHTISQDTVIQNDTLLITPYLGQTNSNALGNFAITTPNKIAFQNNAAFNVLNTLRGNAPNFSIGPNLYPSSPGLRSGETMMVIDGLPMNPAITDYYNLNSFEYQSVSVLSSGNATALYGGNGANGGFFLQSKTGENFTKPSFEFNTTPTLFWSETTPSFLSNETETNTQAVFTNAFAYKQDFGAVDTRVSYTNSFWPDGSEAAETRTNQHFLRINTGFNVRHRFNARLILDKFSDVYRSSQTTSLSGSSITANNETELKNLQGNLQLRYNPFSWLSLSSQSSLSRIENDTETIVQSSLTTNDRQQKRTFANVYASVKKAMWQDFLFTVFAGYQYEKLKQEQQSQAPFVSSESTYENKTTSFLAGAGIQFRNYLFSDFNYRQDHFSVYASENSIGPTYSVNTSFLFSEAFAMNNSWFSFGKFRFSFGKNSIAIRQGFPGEWMLSGSMVNAYPNPGLQASKKEMFETGFDLGFIQNRVTLSASYFNDYISKIATVMPIPYGSGYAQYVIANSWEQDIKGWEIVLGATSIKKSDLTMETKLIWSNYTIELENTSNINTPSTMYPIIRGGVVSNVPSSGNPTQLLSLGSPYPDWTGSLLNQISFKNFFSSFLIDVSEGGVYYGTDFSSGVPVYRSQDASFAKLRDLSVGYKLSSNALSRLYIHEVQLSLSGRNLWTIYSGSNSDREGTFYSTPQKSASLSLTLLF